MKPSVLFSKKPNIKDNIKHVMGLDAFDPDKKSKFEETLLELNYLFYSNLLKRYKINLLQALYAMEESSLRWWRKPSSTDTVATTLINTYRHEFRYAINNALHRYRYEAKKYQTSSNDLKAKIHKSIELRKSNTMTTDLQFVETFKNKLTHNLKIYTSRFGEKFISNAEGHNCASDRVMLPNLFTAHDEPLKQNVAASYMNKMFDYILTNKIHKSLQESMNKANNLSYKSIYNLIEFVNYKHLSTLNIITAMLTLKLNILYNSRRKFIGMSSLHMANYSTSLPDVVFLNRNKSSYSIPIEMVYKQNEDTLIKRRVAFFTIPDSMVNIFNINAFKFTPHPIKALFGFVSDEDYNTSQYRSIRQKILDVVDNVFSNETDDNNYKPKPKTLILIGLGGLNMNVLYFLLEYANYMNVFKDVDNALKSILGIDKIIIYEPDIIDVTNIPRLPDILISGLYKHNSEFNILNKIQYAAPIIYKLEKLYGIKIETHMNKFTKREYEKIERLNKNTTNIYFGAVSPELRDEFGKLIGKKFIFGGHRNNGFIFTNKHEKYTTNISGIVGETYGMIQPDMLYENFRLVALILFNTLKQIDKDNIIPIIDIAIDDTFDIIKEKVIKYTVESTSKYLRAINIFSDNFKQLSLLPWIPIVFRTNEYVKILNNQKLRIKLSSKLIKLMKHLYKISCNLSYLIDKEKEFKSLELLRELEDFIMGEYVILF